MTRDLLDEARRRLPLPALMGQCGHGDRAKKSARCPFHDDSSNSFSVYQHDDGSWAWKCHAGCGGGDEPDWLAKLRGLTTGDACREFLKLAGVTGAPADGPRRIDATYDYADESGVVLFQVVRFEPKTFRQRRPDSAAPDGWSWKLDGVRRVLYRLPEIIAAVQRGETIIVAEGEKDVAALVANGFVATCNPGGAGKWLDGYTSTLSGADVVIVADKDAAGRNHARLIAAKLRGCARSVRIIELPDTNGRPVKDAADFFAAGASADDFRSAMAAAQPVALDSAPDLHAAGPPKNVSKPLIALPEVDEKDDGPAPFPLDALPPSMALLAAGVARTARVPDRLSGVCIIGIVSAAIGAGLEVQSDTQRTTRGNLFLLVSAETGTGKSRTFELIAAPLLDHQERLQEHWQKQSAPRLQSDLKILERELANLEKKVARATDSAERERLRGEHEYKTAQKTELAKRNVQPVLLVQDATTERLTAMVEEQGEVLFSASSDCRKVVDNLMGRYSATKSTDESFYLAGYSGDHVRVDRGGRPPVNLRRPCLGLLWFGQPDLIASMLGEDSLSASGFLPRNLICHSHAAPQRIEGEPEPIPGRVLADWATLVTDLLATYRQPGVANILQPTPQARQCFVEYHNALVDRRKVELRDVTGFVARWCENAWRMAVVLHAGQHGADAHNHPLGAETAANAVRVVEWFAAEQLDILARTRHQAAAKLDDEVLELLNDRIQGKRLQPEERQAGRPVDYVTARILQRVRIATGDAAHALLARMERDGVLEGKDVTPQGGGKSTRIYRQPINPVPE